MNDDELETAMRDVLAAADPVPAAAIAAAHAALSWRTLDAELTLLTAEPERELTHLRGGQPRLLEFRDGATGVELEVSAAGGTAQLLGQLEPPRAARVTVESAAGAHTAEADGRGRFAISGLRDGWLRVTVAFGDADAADAEATEKFVTEWFRS
jgi:hypothetical protein